MFSFLPVAVASADTGYRYGMMGGGMMGYVVFPVLATVFWIVILIDLILLGIWLYKRVK